MFLHKNVIYLFHVFVANNRMNLIVLNQNLLHANGHLNLPWFFIFVWLFIFVGNQMWLGAIKIESQSCINNFLRQNKSIVDIENGFTQTTLRFALTLYLQSAKKFQFYEKYPVKYIKSWAISSKCCNLNLQLC